VVPVVYKAQHALLESLVQSTWWSFATIMPLMMWVTRGFWSGVVVMIPNTLPVLVVFGGMGWLGIPVDIGSMMAASIALGVAVDDTIHFLAWYKDDLKALGDRHEAVLCSYRRSASATLQAGLINGLGLSVFATSSFTPTQRFGWLMLTILVAGITAELIMLPSLMFGPIGGVFSLKPKKERRPVARVRSREDSLLSPLDRRHMLREHGASVEA
jgi:predicted RND superfamily exporter protein